MRARALVTGDQGFIGSHMVKELKSRGWDVYGYDILSEGDAIDYFRSMEDEYFDLVVHCAYVVGGRKTIDGQNLALSTNVQLDGAMFQWALSRAGAVVYYSSSAVYPVEYQTASYGAYRLREGDVFLDDPGTPDALYGWAKLTGEKIAEKFSELGGRVHILRPFSGYSERQSLDYPFPSILSRARGGDYSVWGPKGQSRDWIHVDDVISAALEIYHQDVRYPVNLCTGRATEFGELVRVVASHNTREPKCTGIQYQPNQPTGVFYRVGDPTLLLNHYEPKVTLEEGISRALNR